LPTENTEASRPVPAHGQFEPFVPFIIKLPTNFNFTGIAQTNPPGAMCQVAPGRAMIGWHQ
jgi:hypothetical protein